jgi:hypothetical protein
VELNSIQYRSYLHPGFPPLALDLFGDFHNAKKEVGMLYFQAPSENNLIAGTLSTPLTATHRFC